MKIVIMGSGGVGGFFGGRLAHAGYDVNFVARGAHLNAMREGGLKIENEMQGDIHLADVKVSDDPKTFENADLVLFAVKLWDMEPAMRAVKPIVGSETAVLSLQNGVIKDDLLRREFGAKAVMGGVGYVAASLARPGVIRQTGTLQRLTFGEYDGRTSPRATTLLNAFLSAQIETELSNDIRKTLWEKYCFLVGLSATTTAMRVPIGVVRSSSQARALLFEVIKETVAVGRALGVGLSETYAEDRLAFADSLPAEMTSSMYHDLERGKPLEAEWLSGGVVQLGERVGVPTPANRAIWQILSVHAQGRPAGKNS